MNSTINPSLSLNAELIRVTQRGRVATDDQLTSAFWFGSSQDISEGVDLAAGLRNVPSEIHDFLFFPINVSQRTSDISFMIETTPKGRRSSHKEILTRLSQLKARNDIQRRTNDESVWLANHRREYAGQWIALQGNRLLAHAKDAATVFQSVRGMNPKPLVMQIESTELPFGGW